MKHLWKIVIVAVVVVVVVGFGLMTARADRARVFAGHGRVQLVRSVPHVVEDYGSGEWFEEFNMREIAELRYKAIKLAQQSSSGQYPAKPGTIEWRQAYIDLANAIGEFEVLLIIRTDILTDE